MKPVSTGSVNLMLIKLVTHMVHEAVDDFLDERLPLEEFRLRLDLIGDLLQVPVHHFTLPHARAVRPIVCTTTNKCDDSNY